MTKPKLFYKDVHHIRDHLRRARALASEIHAKESELVQLLYAIDSERYYVRLGFKSLRTFCINWLNYSLTQSQRLVTQVRRNDHSIIKTLHPDSNTTHSDDMLHRDKHSC